MICHGVRNAQSRKIYFPPSTPLLEITIRSIIPSFRSKQTSHNCNQKTMIQSARLGFGGSIMLLLLLVNLIAPVYSCETIGSWNALVAAVKDATDTLSLCPFDIVKPASERLLLDKRLTMVCVGASDTNKCTLRGTGHHVRIVGTNAEITLDGFAFYHATACAVRVLSSATRTQRLRKCIFADSVGKSDGWRGGAIKTELGTNLIIISKSKFVGNRAGGGGAIWHRGSFMEIEESTFQDNSAKVSRNH